MDGHVVVFAPSPLLTVTIEDLHGEPDIHLHPGGQGIWQARMISSLGAKVVVCAALGGETGRVLMHLVEDTSIELAAFEVAGRNGGYVHDRRDGDRTQMVEMRADPLTRHELDDLYETTLVHALRAGTAVLSGPAHDSVVPESLYRRLVSDLTGNGCRVLVDLSGDRLQAALEGGPTFVKVSHEELLDDGLAKSDSLDDLVAAARAIAGHGVETVVVSRAAEPALALHDGNVVTLQVPTLEPVDTRGGGDSMTAGVAATLAQGEDMETALRLGAAAGAVNITRHGLGTGRGETIRELAGRVELNPVKDGRAGKK